MAFPQVIDITKKGTYIHVYIYVHVLHVCMYNMCIFVLVADAGLSPREILANQLASVLVMRRRKQQVRRVHTHNSVLLYMPTIPGGRGGKTAAGWPLLWWSCCHSPHIISLTTVPQGDYIPRSIYI